MEIGKKKKQQQQQWRIYFRPSKGHFGHKIHLYHHKQLPRTQSITEFGNALFSCPEMRCHIKYLMSKSCKETKEKKKEKKEKGKDRKRRGGLALAV